MQRGVYDVWGALPAPHSYRWVRDCCAYATSVCSKLCLPDVDTDADAMAAEAVATGISPAGGSPLTAIAVALPQAYAPLKSPPMPLRWATRDVKLQGIVLRAGADVHLAPPDAATTSAPGVHTTLWQPMRQEAVRVWLERKPGRVNRWTAVAAQPAHLRVSRLCVLRDGTCAWVDTDAPLPHPPAALLTWTMGIHSNAMQCLNAPAETRLQVPFVFMPTHGPLLASLGADVVRRVAHVAALVHRVGESAPRGVTLSSAMHRPHLLRFFHGVFLARPSSTALTLRLPVRVGVTEDVRHAARVFLTHHGDAAGLVLVCVLPGSGAAAVLTLGGTAAAAESRQPHTLGATQVAASSAPPPHRVAWEPWAADAHARAALLWPVLRKREHDAQLCPVDAAQRSMYLVLHDGTAVPPAWTALPPLGAGGSDGTVASHTGGAKGTPAPPRDRYCLAAPARPGGAPIATLPYVPDPKEAARIQWTMLSPRAAVVLEEPPEVAV